MPCLLALLALCVPRVVLLLVFLLTDFLNRAYATALWPLLGFIFMPLTTLAYALAYNSSDGHVTGIYLAIVAIAALIDIGSLGGGGTHYRRRRRVVVV